MVKVNDNRSVDPEDNLPPQSPEEIMENGIMDTDPLVEEVRIPDVPDLKNLNLEMLGDRMLVQNFPKSEKIGHIFIPQLGEVDIDRGRIIQLGPEIKTPGLHEGDVIFKMSGMGQTLKDNKGQEFIFLPSNAAIARDLDLSNPVGAPSKGVPYAPKTQ